MRREDSSDITVRWEGEREKGTYLALRPNDLSLGLSKTLRGVGVVTWQVTTIKLSARLVRLSLC